MTLNFAHLAWRRHQFHAAIIFGIVLSSSAIVGIYGSSARAESPSPSSKMTDVNTYYGYPTGYNAGVLFADAPGCNGSTTPYYPTSVENEAVSWINAGHQTILMLDMASGCDSHIADYESLANALVSNISGRVSVSNMNRYFGGIMVDEEPWFWTSATAAATDYSNFNAWLVINEPGIPLSELGNAGGYWTQAQYNEVAWTYSWSAPQVYNTRTEDNQNVLLNSYGGFETLVTCYPGHYSYPFDTCANAASVIDGGPWTNSTWGGGYWYNQFKPA
jgi:hypothetical protein